MKSLLNARYLLDAKNTNWARPQGLELTVLKDLAILRYFLTRKCFNILVISLHLHPSHWGVRKVQYWGLPPNPVLFMSLSVAHEIQSLWAPNPLECVLFNSITWLSHFNALGKKKYRVLIKCQPHQFSHCQEKQLAPFLKLIKEAKNFSCCLIQSLLPKKTFF